ncbi:uncharacterized protein LOC118756332 isoform X1 [Rhagoletis pomonella]|uniref:uncharacterized protein LOC118756332 isoform X1 n=2 Tax=Rhagoletis pomonella TaxID=28610 RepID=UPI001785CA57|nr:uncharacterized protein LOC118756332 isoform X1 [Rhagoletis pomonella]
MPGSNYNLRHQDRSQGEQMEGDGGVNDGAQGGQFSAIVASLNALTNAVAQLKTVTEESQRDIERLRNNIELDVHQPVVTQQASETTSEIMPERSAQNTLVETSESANKLYDLPTFSGNTEEWPLFLANFKDTTEAFRYSNRQNLMRLHKCLVGRAKETVASMLIYPEDVPNAIAELEFQFGRPDLLVRSQLSKIQQFPNIAENKVEQILSFSTRTRNIVAFLTSAKCEHHLNNTTLLEQLVTKLPPSKQYEWTRHAVNIKPYATIKEFSQWLSDLARVVCLMPPSTAVMRSQQPTPHQQPSRRVMLVGSERKQDHAASLKCYVCDGAHSISDCQTFNESMSVRDRWEKVKSLQLCFSCLRKGHNTSNCRSKKLCDVNACRRYHHRSLHEASSSSSAPPTPQSRAATQSVLNCREAKHRNSQFFKYVPVSLFGPNGKEDVYAMVDEGSAISLLDDSVATRLGLKGRKQPLTLQWYGQKCTTEDSTKVNVEIQGKCTTATYTLRNICTIRNLDLPEQSFRKADYSHLKILPLEDYHQVKPSLLLGLDNTYLSVPSTTVQAGSGNPVAINTKLGWIAYGSTRAQTTTPVVLHIREKNNLESLHELVAEYFAADNFGVHNEATKQLESEDNQHARQSLEANTRRIGKRFETGLLWKSVPPALPSSYAMAYKRLLGIEKRMRLDEGFSAKYKEEIAKYIRNGYARQLSEDEVGMQSSFNWYLPHFAVQSPHKPGKMRIVFDAAAKVNGVSLNCVLLKGPEQAKPLLDILFRFREGAVAVAADIREMFSQVVVKQPDQYAQRFLWRDGDSHQPVQHYVMMSMVFGAVCSPCIAEYVKNKNAEDFRSQYPDAAAAIIDSHYVDDFVASFQSNQDAERVCKEVKFVHAEGGFQLRSFVSNIKELEIGLNTDTEAVSQHVNLERQSSCEKVLGMYWNTPTDSFEFKFRFHRIPKPVLEGVRVPTKRELLSIVMSVFDPFGILADFLLFAKILIQEVWKSCIEWDEILPYQLQHKWFAWWGEFKRINEVKVNRYYSPLLQSPTSVQLHILVDASQVAFAAAGYFRIASAQNVDVAFIAGKTRCAPQKLLSVPRLELQAGVLGVRLAKVISQGHTIQPEEVTFWTDSQTLLQWVNSRERKFKPYVGHRIIEILSSSNPSQWRWVPTDKNTTDIATRPKWPPKAEKYSSWLRGPDFLRDPVEHWPPTLCSPMPVQLEEEVHPCLVAHAEVKDPLLQFNRFSSFLKLRRVMALVYRAVSKFLRREHENNNSSALTVSELEKAEKYIIREVQHEVYAEEIAELEKSKHIPKHSTIRALSPYIDTEGILRLRGRIDEATCLPKEARRPILMPSKHIVSQLIMRQYHQQYHHQNVAVILSEVRQKYWFPHAKSLLKNVQRSCAQCRIDRAAPKPPLMGQLPEDRITPYVRPFAYTGVDLFGPFNVAIGRRREKRWAVIFTCLTIRAAHIELAHDLSTDAFLICLRNFVNRRGTPVRIRSDNGTNFIGAQRELKASERILDFERISNDVSKRGVDWKFNCPSNPSSGGCWERLIHIVKRLLTKIIREEVPREDTLRSVLIEIENILNSRPLTEVPLSSEEDDPITPNHFLLGCSNSTQTPQPVDGKLCLRKQWRIAQSLKDRFWKQWIRHYLPQLLLRQKWQEEVEPLKVNDLVLICDTMQPRSQWQKGRVTRVFPAKDGQIRFAEVKTAGGVLRRPASKIAVLHLDGESLGDSRRGGV